MMERRSDEREVRGQKKTHRVLYTTGRFDAENGPSRIDSTRLTFSNVQLAARAPQNVAVPVCKSRCSNVNYHIICKLKMSAVLYIVSYFSIYLRKEAVWCCRGDSKALGTARALNFASFTIGCDHNTQNRVKNIFEIGWDIGIAYPNRDSSIELVVIQ